MSQHHHTCNPGADGHGHGHDHHSHDHSDDVTPALQSNLHRHIDFGRIVTLNESVADSGQAIVKKTWEHRFDDEPSLESDVDEQVIMSIPFTGQVKLHSLLIYAEPGPTAPKSIKLFRNREDIDFSIASELQATQEIEVPPIPTGSPQVLELPLKRAHFNSTTSVTLFFQDNQSGGDSDVTCIHYIGFKGDFTPLNREPVTVMYESAANPKDHKIIQGLEKTNSFLGGQ
ncbi:hypothetical protein KEM56_001782 [Ascosphaera pollenicola]|nr:hypothetical protein KEM56_001782 [Ascosphaera pollenicola]